MDDTNRAQSTKRRHLAVSGQDNRKTNTLEVESFGLQGFRIVNVQPQ